MALVSALVPALVQGLVPDLVPALGLAVCYFLFPGDVERFVVVCLLTGPAQFQREILVPVKASVFEAGMLAQRACLSPGFVAL